jgi:hypothetical protein
MVNSKVRKLLFVSPMDNGAQVVTSKQLLKTLNSNVNHKSESSPFARIAKLVFFYDGNNSSKTKIKFTKSKSKSK